jgi:drug/metabolite transporter (DMT)-like permease
MSQASPDVSPEASVRRSTLLPALAVAGTVLTWAAAFPAISFALRQVAPLPLAAIRFALAAALALAWLAWRRPSGLTWRDSATVILSGLLGIALYNMLLNSGQATVSAGAASFIINTQPLFMALLAVVFLKEAFNRWSWLGASIGFAGVAVIASGQPGGLSFGTGSSLILAAAACAASYSVLQRPLFARIAPLDVTACVLVAGAVALLPWLPAGLTQAGAAGHETMLAIVYLAVGPGFVGQGGWTYALSHYGAAQAGQYLYLVPPTVVLLAFLMLGETPQTLTLVGGAMALTGVILVNRWGKKR